MRDRPTGEELLALVERIEGGDGSIILPDDERYKELMIAGARAIAERQRDIGDGPEKRELRELTRILGAEVSLSDLNKTLAAAIRAGDHGPETADSAAVGRHLWQTALERVRESSPKVLGPLGLE
jgi:hypothetical protein